MEGGGHPVRPPPHLAIFITERDINFNFFSIGTEFSKLYQPVDFEAAILDIQVTEVKRSSVISQILCT